MKPVVKNSVFAAAIIGAITAGALMLPAPKPTVTPKVVAPRAGESVTYWAETDAQGVVQGVYVFPQNATQDTVRAHFKKPSTAFVQTRDPYNEADTRGKNYAGKGMVYDQQRGGFKPPQPYPSWTLNETTLRYDPPSPYPDDGKIYTWNEERRQWIEVVR